MNSFFNTLARAKQFASRHPARRMLGATLVGMLLTGTFGHANAANKSKLSDYEWGKPIVGLPCGEGPTPLASRTAVLMGGGLDIKEAFTWMITKMAQCKNGSTGKQGNFVVIRAGGNPSYDSFIKNQGPVAAVQTLVLPTVASANDPGLEPYIRNAGAIWITGGDQGDYYNFWKGTLLEKLVSEQVRNYGIPIGGTSAGMMILSEFNYIADPYTIVSDDALRDPYKADSVTLKRDFWTYKTPFTPLLSTVTDSHFDARNRMGRLVTFLARTINDGWATKSGARAIGVDQETALLMEYDGKTGSNYSITTVANPGILGAGYILSAGSGSSLIVKPGTPLTFTNVQVKKLPVNANGLAIDYQINVINGVMTSSNTGGSLY